MNIKFNVSSPPSSLALATKQSNHDFEVSVCPQSMSKVNRTEFDAVKCSASIKDISIVIMPYLCRRYDSMRIVLGATKYPKCSQIACSKCNCCGSRDERPSPPLQAEILHKVHVSK